MTNPNEPIAEDVEFYDTLRDLTPTDLTEYPSPRKDW